MVAAAAREEDAVTGWDVVMRELEAAVTVAVVSIMG